MREWVGKRTTEWSEARSRALVVNEERIGPSKHEEAVVWKDVASLTHRRRIFTLDFSRMILKITVSLKLPSAFLAYFLWRQSQITEKQQQPALWAGGFSPVSGPTGLTRSRVNLIGVAHDLVCPLNPHAGLTRPH